MVTQGIVRLAGYGGAALFVRSVVVPSQLDTSGPEPVSVVFDFTLHSPECESNYYLRAATADFLATYADFCLAAASAETPEVSMQPLNDALAGFEMSVVSSDPTRVGLLVRVARELDATPIDWDAMDFETSRAALAQVSLDARTLLGEDAWSVSTEPPTEWN